MKKKKKRRIPVDWGEWFFLANKYLGLTMDEFLYDYNLELISYLVKKHVGISDNDKVQPEAVEARTLFAELGF